MFEAGLTGIPQNLIYSPLVPALVWLEALVCVQYRSLI